MSAARSRSKVTIKDIARETGVSYSTVSRALNDHEGTSEATKILVRDVAERMGYQANTLARSLAMNQSKLVGVLFPDLSNEFFTDILRSVSNTFSQAGYGVLIYETNWDAAKEEEGIRKVIQRMVDGIVLYPGTRISREVLETIRQPLVILQHETDASAKLSAGGWPTAYISSDNERGGELAADHLADCGYRRPIFFGGPESSESHQLRMKGLDRRLSELGYPELDQRWVTGPYSIESGYQRWRELVQAYQAKGVELPDVVVAGNDRIAIGCMQGIEESGFELASEIGVIGFDDVQLASLPQIQLTTIHLPRDIVGKEAAEHLLTLMEDPQQSSVYHKLLGPTLIARKTTKVVG